jgi:wobble nucleotide-excising tRNase
VSKKIQKELDKIQRLSDFIGIQAKQKESQTLKVLTAELNQSLAKYLTKHFTAKINSSNYRVDLIDDAGSIVHDSTGEGQLLKFAFISMLVAIAAKKTKEKIDFMIDPTIAPLVLDAPLSTLDQNYRSSVVKNLADNVDQLVLMGSSAAWGDSVEDALKPFIGKQYLVISRARGQQDEKSFKSITVGNKTYQLNEYESERNDSYIQEI